MTDAEQVSRLVAAVAALPHEWHGAGTVSDRVLEALARHLRAQPPQLSVETGTGRTTLLFSHLSAEHLVFTKDDAGDGDSLAAVRGCPLLHAATVNFELGPTQRTLLGHRFEKPVDVAYLDGPHAYPFPDLEYWAVYPHIRAGGLLIIDDIQIPTIANLFAFLRADSMWTLAEVADTTAFFRRTAAEAIDPYGEGWWLQGYNAKASTRHLPPAERASALVEQVYARLPPVAQRALSRLRHLGG